MTWEVEFQDDFDEEFKLLDEETQDALLTAAKLLKQFGPQLRRPHVDTLNGSKHSNMKELRFETKDGEWRAAFAFDMQRKALVLVAGDKSGVSEKLFYKQLIAKADSRLSAHLERQKAEKKAIEKGKKGK